MEFGVLNAKRVFVFICKGWWMRLAKYPSVSWRVNDITIRLKFRGGVFLSSIKEHSATSLKATSLKLHELPPPPPPPPPPYHLYPVNEEGGIHSIKHIGWKGWFFYPFTLNTPCKWHNFYIACLHNIIDLLDIIYIARNKRVVFKHTRKE